LGVESTHELAVFLLGSVVQIFEAADTLFDSTRRVFNHFNSLASFLLDIDPSLVVAGPTTLLVLLSSTEQVTNTWKTRNMETMGL